MSTFVRLKILTLNCYALPWYFPRTEQRVEKLGEELSKGEYDIIILQEVWTRGVYDSLKLKIGGALQHGHYFRSARLLGSGLVLFSKFPILESFQKPYSLNGRAHKVQHADYYGGGVMAMVKLDVQGFTAHVYLTHLHALYDPVQDEYEAHRIVQAYELSQFIKLTSESCDAVFVGGDFNLITDMQGYKLIETNANLQDAWRSQRFVPNASDATWGRPDNSFTDPNSKELIGNPEGTALDHWMFRQGRGVDMRCESCEVTMGRIPNEDYNYSDHNGLAAVFTLQRDNTTTAPSVDQDAAAQNLVSAIKLLQQGMQRIKADKMTWLMIILCCLATLYVISEWTFSYGLNFLLSLFKSAIVLCLGYCFWVVLVITRIEIGQMAETSEGLQHLLATLKRQQ